VGFLPLVHIALPAELSINIPPQCSEPFLEGFLVLGFVATVPVGANDIVWTSPFTASLPVTQIVVPEETGVVVFVTVGVVVVVTVVVVVVVSVVSVVSVVPVVVMVVVVVVVVVVVW